MYGTHFRCYYGVKERYKTARRATNRNKPRLIVESVPHSNDKGIAQVLNDLGNPLQSNPGFGTISSTCPLTRGHGLGQELDVRHRLRTSLLRARSHPTTERPRSTCSRVCAASRLRVRSASPRGRRRRPSEAGPVLPDGIGRMTQQETLAKLKALRNTVTGCSPCAADTTTPRRHSTYLRLICGAC